MPIRPENKSRYPRDWHLRRKLILQRAGSRCEWCHAINHEPHPITGSIVVLTIAHIFDHRPEAASLLNLAALCQRCHLNHDRQRHRETFRRERGQRYLFDVFSTHV